MSDSPADATGTSRRRGGTVVLLCLLALGVAARLLGAWCYRHSDNPDYGIVALMARHMAEGSDWPVFFYGQSYMGSLEPAVSAALCRLFGYSGFAVCLGSALLGMLLLPVVYAWGRDAGGRAAGLTALAYCVLGPEGYFHYQASPRGGYPLTLLLGTLILWLACRYALAERDGRRVSPWRYALLGGLGGLGVWSNPLIVAHLIAAAMMFMVIAPRRLFSARLLAAFPAFLLGSLPLWLWNMRNDWASLAMGRTVGAGGQVFAVGQRLLWRHRWPELLGAGKTGPAWGVVLPWLHLLAVFAAAAACLAAARRERKPDKPFLLLAGLLFLVVFSVVFSLSSFSQIHTPRYLLPLVPALGVLVGAATVFMDRVMPWRLGWLPLAVLLVSQAVVIPNHFAREERYAARHANAQSLGEFMHARKVNTVYTPYLLHGLNATLEEQFRFSEIKGERYPPLARAAESARDVAVLNNHGGIHEFLRATRGSAETSGFGRYSLAHELTPPQGAVRALAPARIAQAGSRDATNVLAALTDNNLGTGLTSRRDIEDSDWIDVSLHAPATVSGVRLLNRKPADDPAGLCVEAQLAHGGAWTNVTDVLPFSRYFWSGPRAYWDGAHFRYEARFPPRRVSRVRVRFGRRPGQPAAFLSELQLLEPAGRTASQPDSLPWLLELLAERRIKELHCDRWVANAVHRATAGRTRTPREASLFGADPDGRPPWIVFHPDVALLVPAQEAPQVHALLRDYGIRMRDTVVGPWVLLDFAEGQWREPLRRVPGIRFTGCGCVTVASKPLAEALRQRAGELGGDPETRAAAVAALERALAAYPMHRPAMEMLSDLLVQTGQPARAQHWEDAADALWTPDVPAAADFANGIALAGISILPAQARPGEQIRLRYFWRCPQDVDPERFAVFVHFVGPDGRFQDDHVLLQDQETGYQPFPEIFVEERALTVPRELGPGDYTVRIGLLNRLTPRKRVAVATELKTQRRSVELPLRVTLAAGEETS